MMTLVEWGNAGSKQGEKPTLTPIDNCSYRPSERAPDYEQWRERTDKARAALAAEDRHD